MAGLAELSGKRLELLRETVPSLARVAMRYHPSETGQLIQVRTLAEFALTHGLPSMFGRRQYVEAGGLLSYGANNHETYRRAATYVDRILKGASPADLPIEEQSQVELLVNLRTARRLGIAIPQSLLVQATGIVE